PQERVKKKGGPKRGSTKQSDLTKVSDVVTQMLRKIAQNILLVVLGLSPLFFIPSESAPFNFTKILFVLIGVFTALIFYSFSVFRRGQISLRVSAGLGSAWALAIVVLASATFSGDVRDSVLGDAFGIHTAIFVGLLALVTWIVTALLDQKTSIMRLYIVLTGSGVVIGLYHIIRFFFGPDTLTFGIFESITATPLGGWNDLALFSGLSLLLAMVAVEQFPLTNWSKALFGFVSAVSLIILAVVNFFAIWIVLGLVSLIVLLYTLAKKRFKTNSSALADKESGGSIPSILLSVVVFVSAAIFIIGGSGLGQSVSNLTNVSYVEVRPSLEATIDITRNVYKENALFGVGPNKFSDAWRLHKDPIINQTIFWNSPFDAGFGYIPTFAVTTGVVGLFAWIAFLGFIVRAGYRVLFSTNHVDRFWYFVGTSSFVSALYLWGMSVIYVPGPAILILAAVFTGVLYTAQAAMLPQRTFVVSLGEGARSGFILIASTVIVLLGSMSVLYISVDHYSGLKSFNSAIASIGDGIPLETVEWQISDSLKTSSNDLFAREIVGLQLSKMNSLLTIPTPTEEQQLEFQSITVSAVNAGKLAVDIDPSEPLNWQSLGQVYSVLTVVGIEGAYEQAVESFDNASRYDPTNPEIQLMYAQLESRANNLEAAKAKALEAIKLKPNYTDAFFFVSQVDIARGDVSSAIESTRDAITLEPQNPARHYQLGVLYASEGNSFNAARSFEEAIKLNESYANARYFLALAYDQMGRSEDARIQLERVRELNPDNADVIGLLEKLKQGERLSESVDVPKQVTELEASIEESGAVTATEDPGSSLLKPINTVPEGEVDAEEFTDDPVVADQDPIADDDVNAE
ncbi:MAG: tetratricopeptide (TPR) repeat protein, partial [Candidatus Azotimanducaceae bacterium]